MSWLGVNLNESLSSLKGQLSNLTKEVLSEDFGEEDDDSQVVVPKDRIKELESLCQLQKHELEECKRARAEIEERLHAADIHAAHQNKLLRQQLQEYENELRSLKEKSSEWGWEATDISNHTSNHKRSQNHDWVDGPQALNSHSLHDSLPNALEVQNQQLSRRVEDLERELGSQRDNHQEQVALLQDQHRQQLLALRGQQSLKDGPKSADSSSALQESDDGLAERATYGKDAAAWEMERSQMEMEKEQLKSRIEILQRQVQQLKAKDEEANHLQSKLDSLTSECSTLKEENEQYLKSLEDIDGQHEAAIQLLLKQKESLQEELKTSKAAHDSLAEQLGQIQNQNLTAETQLEMLKSELNSFKENNNSLSSVKAQLETATSDKNELNSQLTILKDKLQQLSLNRDQLSDENEMLKKKVREERSSCASRESLQQTLELGKVEKPCSELQNSITQLDSSLEENVVERKDQNVSESTFKELLSASEEKRLNAEMEITSLNAKVNNLTEEISKLVAKDNERKSTVEKLIEGQQQLKTLEAKLSAVEDEKKSLEETFRTVNMEMQDAKSRAEIMESELQAKVQELEISNETIAELQTKSKHMEAEISKHRKYKKEDHEQLKKILTSSNVEVTNNFGTDIHKIAEIVKDSVWQRDTLERHVSSLAQELREKKEQLQEAETTRIDLERECEDLRDQLEEIQKGVRPQPEGSSRGLPTIEEESEGCAEGDGEVSVIALAEGKEQVKVNRESLQQESASQIEALQAQVEALSEARRNLETEVANMRSERETLQGQLRESEGRTGNLVNLETEAASLRAEKNVLEMRISSLTQQVDLETVTLKDERDSLEELVTNLELHISRLQAEMTLNKHERESIGNQLLAQYEIQENREATIRVLEAELEGLRTQLRERFSENNSHPDVLSRFQAKETKLVDELNSIRSQLIFKEDKIDELTQVLEELGKMFHCDSFNADKVHAHIRSSHKALQDQCSEQKLKIEELEKALQIERDQINRNDSLLESECSLREEREQEANILKEKLEKSEMEVFQLREKVEELTSVETDIKEREFSTLQKELKELAAERDVALSNLVQSASEMDIMKKEISRLSESLEKSKESEMNFQQERELSLKNYENQIAELTKMNREIEEQVLELKKKHECEIQEKENIILKLQGQLSECQKEDNTTAAAFTSEKEIFVQQEKLLKSENDRIHQENRSLQEEKGKLLDEIKEAISARDAAVQQYTSFQAERDQMIATITQKHQESVSYHAEIQRLMQVLNQTVQSSTEEKNALTSQLTEAKSSLSQSQIQVANLREELEGLKKIKEDLQKNVAEDIVKKTEISGLRKEMETLQVKFAGLEQERDQLRIANAHFNTQYQDQSKELSNLREKEGRLSAECERLRQHLVTVEESYTVEAIKAEERENTLRSTLSKMEEKLNNHSTFYNSASQRASVQVESLQEQLRELAAKRDDAILRLHTAEEAAEQHQHALTTLQQVLQDFQKGQAREIAEATERTRRQLEEEQDKSRSLLSQVDNLKAQLVEVQSALAAASRLGEQLDKKEQMIVALKAQGTQAIADNLQARYRNLSNISRGSSKEGT
ncbi:thyroid receptor-interacting protein 11-like isoform X2 [Palaemon carinicauda]|uniref:thyroid receptor-interacting protein 11-like isoform X2 n=1 Tax=Palaemon carinicauda TaxID=392227 RepID=UPI0035B5F7D9